MTPPEQALSDAEAAMEIEQRAFDNRISFCRKYRDLAERGLTGI